MSDVVARAHDVLDRIARAAHRSGRAPEEVTLVAVTKGVEPARIRDALDAWARDPALARIRDLGENRAQELATKTSIAARWHMIGTLQRNKARAVVAAVALIHSVDSLRLAEAIDRAARDAGVEQAILLEVNTSGEASKHGVTPSALSALADSVGALEHLRLAGLMTMAPEGDEPAARACFAGLRDLRDRIARDHPTATELSMGMSGDFEGAVEEGATLVRVGTALFGPRPRP